MNFSEEILAFILVKLFFEKLKKVFEKVFSTQNIDKIMIDLIDYIYITGCCLKDHILIILPGTSQVKHHLFSK
jgi:hypothetical protein